MNLLCVFSWAHWLTVVQLVPLLLHALLLLLPLLLLVHLLASVQPAYVQWIQYDDNSQHIDNTVAVALLSEHASRWYQCWQRTLRN
jgi:hypothetical protein